MHSNMDTIVLRKKQEISARTTEIVSRLSLLPCRGVFVSWFDTVAQATHEHSGVFVPLPSLQMFAQTLPPLLLRECAVYNPRTSFLSCIVIEGALPELPYVTWTTHTIVDEAEPTKKIIQSEMVI
jgi:hypothetical protein